MTAFRASTVGNDTKEYISIFETVNANGIDSNFRYEYGFQALCYFVGRFTDNPQALLVVCATVCYIGVGIYIYKYSANALASLVLVFCLCFSIFTNTLRQDIAMIICLFAYQAIKRRKNIKTLLLIGLASLFHISALITLLWFLKYIIKKHSLKVVIAVCLLLIVLSVSGVIERIILKFASEYENYFTGKYASTGWLAVSLSVAISAILYCLVYNAYKSNQKEGRTVLLNYLLLLFGNCFGFIVNLFTRAMQYFLLVSISEVPNVCCKLKGGKKWLLLICLLELAYFIIVLIFRPGWNAIYPFRFCWN